MGQGDSKVKRLSKQERDHKTQIKEQMISNRVNEIEEAQRNIMISVNTNALNLTTGIDILKISDIAKNQVQRGGSTLTKSDLIAIIMALTDNNSDIHKLQSLTTNDLNVIIRNIIYDPNRNTRLNHKSIK